jgi:hypothetical protein
VLCRTERANVKTELLLLCAGKLEGVAHGRSVFRKRRAAAMVTIMLAMAASVPTRPGYDSNFHEPPCNAVPSGRDDGLTMRYVRRVFRVISAQRGVARNPRTKVPSGGLVPCLLATERSPTELVEARKIAWGQKDARWLPRSFIEKRGAASPHSCALAAARDGSA